MTRTALQITLWWALLLVSGLLAFSFLALEGDEHARTQALIDFISLKAQRTVQDVDPTHSRIEHATPGTLASVVLYRRGQIVDARGPMPPTSVLRRAASLPLSRAFHLGGQPGYVAVAKPVRGHDERVVVFAAYAPIERAEHSLRRTLLLTAIPMCLFAVFAGWLMARALLRPLQASFERERAFIGDVSHELRQPLATITGRSELALRRLRAPEEYRRILQTIHASSAQLESTVADLLLLARADAGAVKAAQAGDLSEAVSSAYAEGFGRREGVRVHVTLDPQPLPVALSETLLTRVVGNLLSNAVHAARSEVRLIVDRYARLARLVVEDDGPGVPVADREQIFRRFHRASRAYPGSGLGLPIAAAIVHTAGGTIAVEDRAGGGARFVVALPLTR